MGRILVGLDLLSLAGYPVGPASTQSLYAGILFEQQLALANSYDCRLILFFISLGITCSA